MVGLGHKKTVHIPYLLGEAGVVGQLELAATVGHQAMPAADVADCFVRQTVHFLRHANPPTSASRRPTAADGSRSERPAGRQRHGASQERTHPPYSDMFQDSYVPQLTTSKVLKKTSVSGNTATRRQRLRYQPGHAPQVVGRGYEEGGQVQGQPQSRKTGQEGHNVGLGPVPTRKLP